MLLPFGTLSLKLILKNWAKFKRRRWGLFVMLTGAHNCTSQKQLATRVGKNMNLASQVLKFFCQLVTWHYNIDTSNIFNYSTGYNTRHQHTVSVTLFSPCNNSFEHSYFSRTIVNWNNPSNKAVTQSLLSGFELHLHTWCFFFFFCLCVFRPLRWLLKVSFPLCGDLVLKSQY